MANKSQAPDVRVRLTAEGLQDVVKAFQTISDEARRSSSGAGNAMKFLNEQIGSLKHLLPSLAAGAVVGSFVHMTKSLMETAIGLGKLEAKTGISIETLSTFSYAAKRAEVDQETLNSRLVNGARFFGQYDSGVEAAREAVEDLFGSQKALEGLNTEQKLLKVVNALAKLPPSGHRADMAQKMFGKGAQDLLPVIDELGEVGFAKLAQRAKELAINFSKDTVEGSREAHLAFVDLKAAAEGLALQFSTKLLPLLGNVTTALTNQVTGEGIGVWKRFGEAVGHVLADVLYLLFKIGVEVMENAALVSAAVQNLGRLAGDSITMGPKAAWEKFNKEMEGDAKRISAWADETKKKMFSDLQGENKPTDTGKKGDDNEDAVVNRKAQQDRLKAAKLLADAQRKLVEARLANELTLLKAGNKAINDEESRRYQDGLTALDDYYNQRADRINQEADKEFQVLMSKLREQQAAYAAEQRRTLPRGETEGERQARLKGIQKDIEATQTQIQVAEIERGSQLAANDDEHLQSARTLRREQLQAEAELLQAEGDRWTAEEKNLEAQVAGLARLKGESDADFTERQQRTLVAGQRQLEFDKQQAAASQAMRQLDLDRADIENQIAAGKLSSLTGEEQLRQIEQQRLPTLQAIADAMVKAAVTAEQLQAAREFQTQVDGLRVSSSKAAKAQAQLTGAMEDGVKSGLLDFFTQGIDQADSFADAMRNLGLTIVDSLRQAVAQMLVTMITMKLMQSILGAAVGAAGGGASSGGGGGGGLGLMKVGGAASGGLITGPGTGTSDSIPARLSDGEFVVRSAVVRQPGVLKLLTALNAAPHTRSFHGFAEGGLVEASAQGQERQAGIRAVLDLDPVLTLKRLEATAEWSRVLVRTAENNRKRMNSALGKGAQ